MKVSVLINNYNYGKYIFQCLESLQEQSVLPDEVILYDDGSTDNSLEIAAQFDFVRIISNPNYGKKPAFNQANGIYQAFRVSTGDIICLLDSDDFFHVDKVSDIKNAFINNPDSVLVQHGYYEYRDGKVVREVNNSVSNTDYKELYSNKNWTAYFNPTSTLSFKRSYLCKLLPIVDDTFWRVWPDVRLSRLSPYFGKVVSLPDALTFYRKHYGSDSAIMNIDYKKTLQNQIDHHEYINFRLQAMGIKGIAYKSSFSFFKYKVKASLPKGVINFFQYLSDFFRISKF